METLSDKLRALVYAVLVHAVCVLIAFFGLLWTREARPISVPGPVIQAELVGPAAAPKPRSTPRPKPPPKPAEPAPEPPKPPAPAEPQRNDAIERERVAEIAQQKAEAAQRAEEERRRQEQVLLEQQQREREEQLRKIKTEREKAEKQRKVEEEKLKQLQDLNPKAKPAPPRPQQLAEAEQAKTGTNGQDDSLLAQYSAAIQNAVRQNWNRPDNAQSGLRCSVRVIQIPGGDVISANVASPCNADQVTRASIEQAVTKAQPLPYKGYEKVFTRELTFIFTYDGN